MIQSFRQPVQGPKRLPGFCFRERAYVHQLLDECLKTARVPAPYSSDLKRGRVKKHVIRGAKADVVPPGSPPRLIGARRESVTMHEQEQIQILWLSSRWIHGPCSCRVLHHHATPTPNSSNG